MFTSIAILIVAVSGLISTVLANKRVDRIQEEINNIKKASEYISSINTDNVRGILKEISDIKIKNFPAVDYYVLQKNTQHQYPTRIINEFNGNRTDETMDLYSLPFIPNLINDKIVKILDKILKKPGLIAILIAFT